MNLHNISVISRYERRLLRRGWLFRIFAVLSLLTVAVCHVGFQSNIGWSQWDMTAMASSIPFVNTYIFNIAQSIIAVFLAGSFLKRDKKLDTAEVIYVHPMSNADYIVGKTLGIVEVFVGLNLVAMLLGLLVHLFASDSAFALWPYVFYLVTLSLPSLVFVLGLSFVVMSLVRNQAVTFVVMLGFMGVTMFYLGDTVHGTFDFFAMTLPNIFSEVTGHADMVPYLLQRAGFLVLGLGLLVFTIVMVQRLPLHPRKNVWLGLAGCVVVAVGAALLWEYVEHFNGIKERRQEYVKVYRKYNAADKVDLVAERIVYTPQGEGMVMTAEARLVNRNHRRVEEVLLYLNPWLEVEEVSRGGKAVAFERDGQVVVAEVALEPYEEVELEVRYRGTVDEYVCYLDVDDEDFYSTMNGNSTLRYGKHYAFVGSDYTLLTPEVLWYPVSRPPVNPENPYHLRRDFTDYSLKVVVPNGQMALSQGRMEEKGDTVVFVNEQPLGGISLAMGDYERHAVEVDSTEFALYLFRGHDMYTGVFTELGDTLEGFIRDMLVEYEVNKGREYPFHRFALTETPISFTGYVRNWKGYSEQVQPEYVFLPERGTTVDGNMKEEKKRVTRWAERDDRQSSEPVDIEMRVVRNFVTRQLEEETKWELEGSIFLSMATMDWNGDTELNPYDVSALFFNHAYSIYSGDFPVMDVVLNLLQKQSDNDPRQRWRRMFSGMTDAQRAAIYLDGRSFEQALLDEDLSDVIFYEMLKLKANYLKHYLSAKVSAKAFDAFMHDFTGKNQFRVSTFGEFNAAFQKRFQLNLMDLIPTWYTRTQTPIILVKGTRAREVSIEEHTRYLVDFQVYNPTDVEGVISVEVEERGGMGGPMGRRGGSGGMSEDREVLNYIIEPRKYKEIRILCDDRPNHMTVNTNIAQNIPSDVMQHFQRIDEVTTDTVTGIFDCDGSAFTISDDEIVVDNEDRGFRVIEANQKNKLQNFFRKEDEDKYKNLNFWSPPTRWTATVGTNFYGDYINSCMYKRAGNGNNKAEWTANIKREGYYEVYVYIPGQVGPPWMNRDERYQYYTVKHDDGEDEISIQASGRRSEGWTVLGSFYFSEGKATVTLSDRGSGNRQMIFADAVKWVYANNNKR